MKIQRTPISTAFALVAAIMGTAFALTPTYSFAQQSQSFPIVSLNAGMHVIKAEVATTEAQREQGLMFRKQMGENEGMVFIFDQPAGICMWMKNTLIPLSVAFLDEKGAIINVEEMQKETLDSHCAQKPARYALEMNPGWFKKRNLKAGTVIQGIPKQ